MDAPPAAPQPVAPQPVVTVTPAVPPGAPPIVINITNNNNGNNSNTNTQTNDQNNSQTNNQTNTQTNNVPVTNTITPAPPSAAPVVREAPVPRIARAVRDDVRWLMVGATREVHGDKPGARASIDLFARGHVALGVDAAVEDGKHLSGGAYLAYTTHVGPLDVRAELGAGVGPLSHEKRREGRDERDHRDGINLRAQAAVLVGLPLGRSLGVVAGPIVTATDLGALADHHHGGRGGDDAVDVTLFAGLRYRL